MDWVTPPPEAEIVTMVWTETGFVKTKKPPCRDPAGTVTMPGILAAAGLLLVN